MKSFLALLAAFGIALVSPPTPPQANKTTFADLAPVFREKCAPCHRPGGTAPFALLDYADVKKRAIKVGVMVASYAMPPCRIRSDFGDICGVPQLTFKELVAIRRWSLEGAPEGPPKPMPALPLELKWPLGDPDLVLHQTGIRVNREGGAYWKAYVLPLPRAGKLRAFDIRANSPQVIRQALVSLDPDGKYSNRDRAEIGPGFPTNGSLGRDIEHLVGAWAPTYRRWSLPKGVAVPASKALVVQVQYNPIGRAADGGFELALYYNNSSPETPKWLSVGTENIHIGATSTTVIHATKTLDKSIRVISIVPEARLTASSISLTATQPQGQPRQLFGGSWDLYWIGAYNFQIPPVLKKGTKLELAIEYNNGLEALHSPAKSEPVKFGYGPRDELCWAHIQYLPN